MYFAGNRRARARVSYYILPLLSVLLACGIAVRAWAIGGQFGLEFAIDAPWRMEPRDVNGRLIYGPIPINVAFHDAIFDETRDIIDRALVHRVRVGKFVRVEVVERLEDGNTKLTRVSANQLRDIQRKRQISISTYEPPMEVCEPSSGSDCSKFLDISHTHEWHAMFYYRPGFAMTPGRNVQLEVTVVTRRGDDERRFRNDLVVHLGEAPLPRFSNRWLYGDLHYHSQMTDNEGESAYTYRNTVRALAAVGMDYVFATDHASASVQFDGGFTIKSCGPVRNFSCTPAVPERSCSYQRNRKHERDESQLVMLCSNLEARDLNRRRFRRALREIKSANAAIRADTRRGYQPTLMGRRIMPQIYLGEELDAWPQMSNRDYLRGYIAYGDGLRYEWPDSLGCLSDRGMEDCKDRYARQIDIPGYGKAIMVLDDQGFAIKKVLDELGIDVTELDFLPFVDVPDIPYIDAPFLDYDLDDSDQFPARQHLVYMPDGTGDQRKAFIPSHTGPWGGASHPLPELLTSIEKGGVAFLAHPLISSKPGSKFGPDIVPYSTDSLNAAWASPAILGLQIWNEDSRVLSGLDRVYVRKVVEADNSGSKSFKYLLPWRERTQVASAPKMWQKRHDGRRRFLLRHGTHVWDRYLRKGLDPRQVSRLPWVPKGYPRRWFMAGGSDAHGDFNYRRHGRPSHGELDGRCNEFWCDFDVTDTAIGKPRNLTFVHRASRRAELTSGLSASVHTTPDIVEALRMGAYTVTDGPALRIAIDRNNDEKLNDDDFPMGSVARIYPGEHIPLLIEWKSTAEFGPVKRVDLYVGNKNVVFAPKKHGPEQSSEAVTGYVPDPSGGHLQLAVPANMGMHGLAVVDLAPQQFGIDARNRLFFVRAFAETGTGGCPRNFFLGGNSCGGRFAFTNPVWGDYTIYCGKSGRSIDANGNSFPDTCEMKMDDPCLSAREEAASRRPDVTGGKRAPGGYRTSRNGRTTVTVGQAPPQKKEGYGEYEPVNEPPWKSCSSLRLLDAGRVPGVQSTSAGKAREALGSGSRPKPEPASGPKPDPIPGQKPRSSPPDRPKIPRLPPRIPPKPRPDARGASSASAR